MKIVSEYLNDNVEFVEGDWVVDDNDVMHQYWHQYANRGMPLWMDDVVTKFTWRNYTGTPPTYTNLVEVKQRNGTVYVDYVKNIDFTLELSDDDVVQWKPYIECELDWVLGENIIKDLHINHYLFTNNPSYRMRIMNYHNFKSGE